jgi:dihydroorotate dehydrogenase (NAD+) catalytic subunit
MSELGVELAGVTLACPLVLASGIAGVSVSTLERAAWMGAGAVTTKSFGLKPRSGHPNPTVLEWECGVINAVGLSNPGLEEGIAQVGEAVKAVPVPVVASVFGATPEEFGEVAHGIASAGPALVEANLSCPNVMREHGLPFAYEPGNAAEAVRAVKRAAPGIPVIAKLSPNTFLLQEVARAVEKAGADAINMGNTLGPGMVISIEARRPVLSNRAGGVSGPAVRPVAVRCVWDVFEAVSIPIVGTGGVCTGRDALEMVMAGATAVGVGSALRERGFGVFKGICGEMAAWMEENRVKKLSSLVGVAHE